MNLRFIVVPVILSAVSLAAQSSQAIDIPRPHISPPTVNIPRPNIPNVAPPRVTVPQITTAPHVSTPNVAAPKVSMPKASPTTNPSNTQKTTGTNNLQKATNTNDAQKSTDTDGTQNSGNAAPIATKKDSSVVYDNAGNATSTSNNSNGNANAAQSIAPPAPGNAATSNSSANPNSSSVVNAGPLLMGGPGQPGCPACKPGVVYNNVSPTCTNCTFTFNVNAPGCATNGAACWIPATTPSVSGLLGNNPGSAANNVNPSSGGGGGTNSDQFAIGRGTGDYNPGPITVADPTDPSKSINALPPANGNNPTTNGLTNNNPTNYAGSGLNVPSPGTQNAAIPNSLPTVTIPLPNGSSITATVNPDGTYNIPGQNTPLSNAGVLAAYGANSSPGPNAQNPAPALSPSLNGGGGQAPNNNTQTANGAAGTVNPTPSAPQMPVGGTTGAGTAQIPTAAAGTNGGCLPDPCNPNGNSNASATASPTGPSDPTLPTPQQVQDNLNKQNNLGIEPKNTNIFDDVHNRYLGLDYEGRLAH